MILIVRIISREDTIARRRKQLFVYLAATVFVVADRVNYRWKRDPRTGRVGGKCIAALPFASRRYRNSCKLSTAVRFPLRFDLSFTYLHIPSLPLCYRFLRFLYSTRQPPFRISRPARSPRRETGKLKARALRAIFPCMPVQP